MEAVAEMTAAVKNVPALRFPEFEREWEKVLLEEIAVRGSGHTPNKAFPSYYDGEIKWVSLVDSKYLDNGYIDETTNKISEEGIKNSSAVLHPRGSVLLSRDAGVGKSAVMKYDMAVSQHFIVWRPKKDILSNWFLYYTLQIMKPEFERIAIGNTIKTIGLPYFKKLKVTVPNFFEQQKIASFLSAADEKIQQLSKKKKLLEKYKKGVMQQIFSQQIRFKNDNGNDFPEWEEKRLGDIAVSISNGVSIDQNQTQIGYKVTRIETISSGEIDLSRVGYVDTEQDITKYKLAVGDLLFSNINSVTHIGKIAFVYNDLDLYHGMNLLRISIDKINHYPLFHYYQLTSKRLKQHFERVCNQAVSQASINQTDLKKTKLFAPALSEQVKIANFLSAIDIKIDYTTKQLEQAQQFKKGLLQQMFV